MPRTSAIPICRNSDRYRSVASSPSEEAVEMTTTRASAPPASDTKRARIWRWRSLSSAPPMMSRWPARACPGLGVAGMARSIPNGAPLDSIGCLPGGADADRRARLLRGARRRAVGVRRAVARCLPRGGAAPPSRSRTVVGGGDAADVDTEPGVGRAARPGSPAPLRPRPRERAPPRRSTGRWTPGRRGAPLGVGRGGRGSRSRARGTSRSGAGSPASASRPRSSWPGRPPRTDGS